MISINFTPRLYQESILYTITQKNTLVVLPTGLGKTKIGILASVNRLKTYPQSKILVLTPTKPLASQIKEEFLASTSIQEVVMFTGEINPLKREELIKNAKVIVSTPQTITNDIINEKLNVKEISLLIIDEAHRAVGNYDYVWIAKQYQKKAEVPRII